MKSPILWLPTLMMAGLALGFALHPPAVAAPQTPEERAAEIRTLRRQLKTDSGQLKTLLEAQDHPVVPRGGLSSGR